MHLSYRSANALFCYFLLLGISTIHGAWNLPDPKAADDLATKTAPASSPLTYADEKGFQERAKIIIEGVATNGFAGWRTGFFAGGDPGKYVPLVAMAKLLLDSQDADARAIMNDDRSYKEQYHFAVINWSRFLPIFGDAITPGTRRKFSDMAAHFAYFGQGGTENHKTMWITSANILPGYVEGDRFSNMSREEALARAKQDLRTYVKNLYMFGQGEWDSSTYLMFDVHGMMNVYDFSHDPETRLIAKAALDWLLAGYALKYRDGVYTAPNQRGYAHGPMSKIADQTGWLWWDSHRKLVPADTKGFLYAMHAVTSRWRPDSVLSNIARKNLPQLPFEAHNTKPNYWYGQGIPPKAGDYQESFYVAKHYSMGSIWTGFGGQITRFQLVADSPDGGIVFTGGNPRKSDHTDKLLDEISYEDGNGRYDQSAQAGSAYVSISNVPEMDSLAYSFFSIPDGATRPVQNGRWWVMQAGETFLGIHPLSGSSRIGESDLSDQQKTAAEKARAEGREPKAKPFPILRFEGRKTGFILETADTTKFHSLKAFGDALASVKVDTGNFAKNLEVSCVTLEGNALRVKYQEGKSHADVSIDGKPADPGNWTAVYDSPYISDKGGILTVNDGNEGYIVDFTGDMPVYKPWKKPQ